MNQTKRFKQFAIGITFAIALSLTACSGEDTNVDPAPLPATEMPSEQPDTASQPSAEPSGKPGEHSDSNDGKDETGVSETGVLIGSIYDLAKEGKVPGSEYAAHFSLYDEIEIKWGKADTNESAGKGMYAAYADKGITFGYNKGMVVFDVRSYADSLHAITLKDLEIALGTADEQTVSGSDTIYSYAVNKQFLLKFVIPGSTGQVDHISVYSPEDAKNNMAG